MKRLYLIDGHALIFKMYYAFLRRPMINSSGEDMSIIYGFTKAVLELVRKEKPTHLAVAFDPPAKTFRHEAYEKYKANRMAAPETVKAALDPLVEIMKALNIPVLMKEGFEADDVIGTIAKKAEKEGFNVYMYTPDKDYGQLISDHIYQYKPPKSGDEGMIIGKKEICAKYCIEEPEQFADILAIWGDASDNVPGIAGIGEVGATKLISVYGSIDNIYKSLDKLTPKQRTAFENGKEQIEQSRFLVRIRTDVDMEFDEEECRLDRPSPEIENIVRKHEMTSLLKLLPEMPAPEGRDTQAAHIADKPAEVPAFKEIRPEDFRCAEDMRVSIYMDTKKDEGADSGIISVILMNSRYEYSYMEGRELRENGKYTGILKSILENKDVSLAGKGLKQVVEAIRAETGIDTGCRLYDIELMHYLINPERTHNIRNLSLSYLGFDIDSTRNLKSAAKQTPTQMDLFAPQKAEDSSEEKAKSNGANICYASIGLCSKLLEELEKSGESKLYDNMEMPLIYVLADMEFTGVKVDLENAERQKIRLSAELREIEGEARLMAGVSDLNLSSPKQIGTVIYEKLKLDPKVKKNSKSNYPTDEETLAALADKHPFINKLLDFRGIKKLLSTYIEPLPGLVSPRTGRIHTTFNQALTATGRLSSTKPNLQNIPIRSEMGRELRKNFISGFPDGRIMSADYSQIELRLMAHMSGDCNMINDFREGKDIHTATAARIFGVNESEVSREQRGRAKTANFGIIYGISPFGLSQRLGIPRAEAKSIITEYFANYPAIKSYIDRTIENARAKGYVETIYGRKRFLPDINSRNAVVRGLAERNAVNAPIQGSAADIIKAAMIEIHDEMRRMSMQSKMILQVHDELVFDVYPEEMEVLKSLVKEKMENVIRLEIPLIVECGSGNNWLEAH